MNTKYVFSIIVVNYNSRNLLLNLIESINEHIKFNVEIIIVDNFSSDHSIDIVASKFRLKDNIKFILNKENKGFSFANNQGAGIAEGRYLHFLNPDTLVTSLLNDYYNIILSNGRDIIYVTSLVNIEGQEIKSRQRIPTLKNYMNSLFVKSKVKYWYTGASLIMSQETFQKIGNWNSAYFLYAEDLDLFYRASMKQVAIEYIDAKVTHIEKGCSSNIWDQFERELRVQKSFKLFFEINRNLFEYYLVTIVILFYVLLKEPSKILFYLKAVFFINFTKWEQNK